MRVATDAYLSQNSALSIESLRQTDEKINRGSGDFPTEKAAAPLSCRCKRGCLQQNPKRDDILRKAGGNPSAVRLHRGFGDGKPHA